MEKNFEVQLPQGYVLKEHVDAKCDKKIMTVYTLLSFVPFLIFMPLIYWVAFARGGDVLQDMYDNQSALWVFCLFCFVYIVLHELVHGAVYKYFTGGKLTYGFTLTVAFCGVPDLYVRRKASIAALAMPFLVFSVLFGGLTVWMFTVSNFFGLLSSALLCLHLGGCVGDLHWILMYLTKYKHCETLMRDTGPEQWLYVLEEGV